MKILKIKDWLINKKLEAGECEPKTEWFLRPGSPEFLKVIGKLKNEYQKNKKK